LHHSCWNYRDLKTHYAFSLSEERDLLSQWRGYSDDGTGVAIGFNINEQLSIEDDEFHFVQVDYKSSNHVKNEIKSIYSEHYLNYKEEERIRQNHFGKKINEINFNYKNDAFMEEKEWRFIRIDSNANTFPNDMNPNFKRPIFRVSGNRLISYYNYPFEKLFLKKGPINEIVLGPKCNISDTELKLFLDVDHFRNIQVSYSNATYR